MDVNGRIFKRTLMYIYIYICIYKLAYKCIYAYISVTQKMLG